MKSLAGLGILFLLFGTVVLFQNNLRIGTVVSVAEVRVFVGGGCYRDGITTTTVCSANCGGTVRKQSRSSGETGSTGESQPCITGYDCKYDSYGDTSCSGGTTDIGG